MTDHYRLLRYRGRVDVAPGQPLGCDVFGRPYEVIDADYDEATDTTTVHMQYRAAHS